MTDETAPASIATPQTAATTPVIEAINLRKEYDGGDVIALRGANLAIHAGEFVAVMGPSGSGKSTLLHLLGTLDKPTSGQVMLLGKDVASVRDHHLLRARTIGFIFQLHNLIPSLPLLDNVMVPMVPLRMSTKAKRERATKALEGVGLGHRLSHTPGKVSGGERQRAAFARALVNDPQMILADEPTGNVDTATGEKLLDLLIRIKQERGTTLVIVTHNPELAVKADRVVIIRDGELTEFPRDRIPRDWQHSNPFLQ
ncbi:MAG: ABC transporter ATP-binding protein [Planctomycetota bacterium]